MSEPLPRVLPWALGTLWPGCLPHPLSGSAAHPPCPHGVWIVRGWCRRSEHTVWNTSTVSSSSGCCSSLDRATKVPEWPTPALRVRGPRAVKGGPSPPHPPPPAACLACMHQDGPCAWGGPRLLPNRVHKGQQGAGGLGDAVVWPCGGLQLLHWPLRLLGSLEVGGQRSRCSVPS